MANAEIERVVDGMIQSGRIPRDLRDTYVKDLESGLGNHLLMGSDYTKKTQELANARREAEAWLQTERQKLQADRTKLDGWYGTVQGELTAAEQLRVEKEAVATRLAAAEQALRDYQIHEQVNLPPINPMNRTTPTPPVTPTDPVQPTGSFMTRDEFDKVGAGFMALMDKMERIRAKHWKLYNEPLDDDLVTHFQRTGEDPEQYWRVKYGVENREKDLIQKRQEAEKAAMKEELRRELQMEYANDPTRITGMPGQAPRGGLTPALEHYAGSRALAHSQNGEDKKSDFVPPEMRTPIQSSRDSIAASVNRFNRSFDSTGIPISDEGKQLYQKHLVTS